MAITKEELDRILGSQSAADRYLPIRGDVLKAPSRGIVSGAYADLLQPVTNNAVGNFLVGDIQRALRMR